MPPLPVFCFSKDTVTSPLPSFNLLMDYGPLLMMVKFFITLDLGIVTKQSKENENPNRVKDKHTMLNLLQFINKQILKNYNMLCVYSKITLHRHK